MELNVYWHGTDDELRRLVGAVERNCSWCPPGESCPAHAMLQDERLLNHLVYAVRIRARLELEEWTSQDALAGGGLLPPSYATFRSWLV